MATNAVPAPGASKTESDVDNKRMAYIVMANIKSARSVSDAIRATLGPKGMAKLVSNAVPAPRASKTESYVDNKRMADIAMANINSARSVSDAIRATLGPKGMAKLVSKAPREVIITNDGATILNKTKRNK